MNDVTFAVLDVAPEPYSVTPVLTARVGVVAVATTPYTRSRCGARCASSRCGGVTPTKKPTG